MYMEQISIFDKSERMLKLSKLGDNLERLNSIINWEVFRTTIENALSSKKKSAAGRPPFDHVLLFKIIVLQRIYNLSDDAVEYQINDRLTFMRFLGLGISSSIPDAKTIWKFKNDLKNANVIKELFDLFNSILEEQHIITHEGTIVDATFVDVPRQRNKRKENESIKEGKIPEEWSIHKYAQKDTDARWAKKGNETHYGYKDLVKADADSKIVTDYIVTSASVHDSQEFLKLIDKSDKKIYVMSLPPKNTTVLSDYFNAGVTQIGFNIEIFNPSIAQCIMPGKGKITRRAYFDALEKSTHFWGNSGNVRSLIIVGLEQRASLVSGIEKLCQLGVMPILSVFRPIPGTFMENVVPPSNNFLRKLYVECESICIRYNLHLGPDCAYCQNNTLSLPFWIE